MTEQYFSAVDAPKNIDKKKFSGNIRVNDGKFPQLDGVKVALFGVYDGRFEGSSQQPQADVFVNLRDELHNLYYKFGEGEVADLGNLIPGQTVRDTLSAVSDIVADLSERGIISLVMGNHQMLGAGQYYSFDSTSKYTELSLFDSSIKVDENSLIYHIVQHEPAHLFNLNAIGYQTYLTDDDALKACEKMYFDTVRLGSLRGHTEIAEPALRSSQVCVFDMACLKYSDAPGTANSSPNGIAADEACIITRFAGAGGISSMGLYGYVPENDTHQTTARLMAQMVWYFIDGVHQRRVEDPLKEQEKFMRYRTALNEGQHEIIFYKSKATSRWWMEIPHPKNNSDNTFPIVVPCSYTDYQTACNNEMPDRWWRVYQKYC